MTSFENALQLVLKHAASIGTERIPVSQACGRWIASDAYSLTDLPAFDNAAVDGYALQRDALSQIGESIKVVAMTKAGASPVALEERGAVKVMTGAPVPVGTVAVVMKEDVEEVLGAIRVSGEVKEGFGVRRKAEESQMGDLLVAQGTLLTPPVLALLASSGNALIDVSRKPSVTIVVTGDELVPPGQELGAGQIYESNGIGLSAALEDMRIPHTVTYARDNEQEVRDAIDNALQSSDVVLTTGGVSVGEFDLVRAGAKACGVDDVFWNVAIKPGKPLYFGKKGHKLFFGLPGNPVSALVTFAVFVAPVLRKMQGCAEVPPPLRAVLKSSYRSAKGKTEFARGVLSDGVVTIDDRQGSHMIGGLARANVLAVLPPKDRTYQAAESVDCLRLPWRMGP